MRNRRAVAFLEKHQRLNGGWGEDFSSCYNKDISAHGMKASAHAFEYSVSMPVFFCESVYV